MRDMETVTLTIRSRLSFPLLGCVWRSRKPKKNICSFRSSTLTIYTTVCAYRYPYAHSWIITEIYLKRKEKVVSAPSYRSDEQVPFSDYLSNEKQRILVLRNVTKRRNQFDEVASQIDLWCRVS